MKLESTFFRTLAASFALAAASIATPLTAQTGGTAGQPNYVPGYRVPYGQGCGSTAMGPVQLAMTSLPDIGTNLDFELSNGVAGNPAWLMLGFAPLNIDLTPIGAWGCHLYVDPLAFLADNISAVGTAQFQLPVPNNPALIGVHVFAQGLAQDAFANAFGFSLTNGLEVSIGGKP